MDALSSIEGTELPDISIATYVHFIPQLLRNPLIQDADPITNQYGPFGSQKLDIYTPPSGVKPAGGGRKPPIFIFYYGGGYMSGRRQMSLRSEAGNVFLPDLHNILRSIRTTNPNTDLKSIDHLYHQNIGTFIASHGFVAVIPDYRLVNMDPDSKYNYSPECDAVYPSGAEDVTLSMRWIGENISQIADTDTIFAIGHSAGANHLMTAILLPQFIPANSELKRKLKKVVTLSATFDYIHSREQRKFAWLRYFGGFELIGERCPTGLVRSLKDGNARTLPDLLCLHARRDHFGAKDPQKRFWDEWIKKSGRGEMRELPGKEHNHMSTICGIGSGDAEVEQWLVDVLRGCVG